MAAAPAPLSPGARVDAAKVWLKMSICRISLTDKAIQEEERLAAYDYLCEGVEMFVIDRDGRVSARKKTVWFVSNWWMCLL
jgi:hypothetical protein